DQYAGLPGPVYALGFVRTYADYLGLDGEMFARRFKSEIAGLEKRRDFTLPMPLPERGVPGGAILLVALIVAACAYAVWLYRGSGERARPERVAAVPEQLMPLPPAPPPPPPATAALSETPSANSPAANPPAAAPDGTPPSASTSSAAPTPATAGA